MSCTHRLFKTPVKCCLALYARMIPHAKTDKLQHSHVIKFHLVFFLVFPQI